MEKKTKYRIVGILAIVALAIAAIPLLQKNNEFKTETVAIKAPPFPDQAQSTETASDHQVGVSVQQSPTEVGNNGIQLDTEDVITTIHPSIVNDVQDESSKSASQELNTKAAQPATTQLNQALPVDKEPVVQKAATDAEYVKKVSARLASVQKQNNTETQTSDDGLVNLNKAAWVIQIGSFKYKANALRMVNELRANGYRAFIQKTSTHLGENTRVFVGPENKQNDAYALAMRLENDLHIHGIVISYKPLAL